MGCDTGREQAAAENRKALLRYLLTQKGEAGLRVVQGFIHFLGSFLCFDFMLRFLYLKGLAVNYCGSPIVTVHKGTAKPPSRPLVRLAQQCFIRTPGHKRQRLKAA